MSEHDAGYHVGNVACPNCNSTDNLGLYLKETSDGDFYDATCFGCAKFYKHNELLELGVIDGTFKVDKAKLKAPRVKITKEERKELWERTNSSGKMLDGTQYRGLKDEYLAFYGHRFERNAKGEIIAVYYPETLQSDKTGILQGYKSRVLPKKFGYKNIGKTGISNDLSGSSKFQSGGRFLVITAGEEDKVAAFQMFRENQIAKGQGDYDPIVVVSMTTGEGSVANQVAAKYDYVDSFENIVIMLDNDETGRASVAKLVEVLPKDKVKVATLSGKDPNQMLLDGKQKQFISNFWDAKEVGDSVVKTSKQADDEMEIELSRESIPLPPFMSDLQEAMAGGIRLGYLVVIAAQTGGGKTTIVNECVYFWLFHSPYKVGILSLELNAGQYQSVLLSRHIGTNINLLPTPQERIDFVQQDWVKEKRVELKETEYGEPRYSLLDEREGTLTNTRNQIEKMIRRDNCKVIMIDPVNDLFEGVSLEEQTGFIKYLKALVKQGVTVIAIAHITKGRTEIDKSTGKRIMRVLTEDDLAGVSNLAKSSGCTVLTSRDKYADDQIEKNTTYPTMPKCRWAAFSGDVSPWYYDRLTHTMYDKRNYLEIVHGKPNTVIKQQPELPDKGMVETIDEVDF